MVQQLSKQEIVYPDSDGQPMADNTKQFRWIVNIKENIESIYQDDPKVFVAGDLLWYPVEGNNAIRQAPDTMVVFGRPKGDRGSYMQWKEDNIAPQVVFEVLSPGNRKGELAKKFQFYRNYGVQEYYVYDPYSIELIGWQKEKSHLEMIPEMNGWVSPLLKIRFVLTTDTLRLYRPNGQPFISLIEAETARDQAQARAEALASKLKELGIDPEQV